MKIDPHLTPKHSTWLVILLLASIFAGGCGAEEKAAARKATDAEIMKASQALAPIKAQLKQALVSSMQEHGPVKAIDACRLEAPEIIQAAAANGFEVGRTSTKLRNADNAAEGSLATWLEFHQSTPNSDVKHAEILPDGKVLYAEPMFVAPVCLSCHGENIPTEVKSELDRLYPNDQAIGFKENDFRGLIWIKL
ncbi:MAG: DUF3365 domain-containing protein [Planctomycetes bacterium]|nr:DUF3365 domain-containing protein [Planctomycetota bacterium]